MRQTLTFAMAMLLGVSGTLTQLSAEGPVELDLKLVQIDQSQSQCVGMFFDDSGQSSIFPFANDAGKLLVKLEGENVRVDTNGDGVIDEKDGPAFKPNQTIVKVCCKFLGKPVQYPLTFSRVIGRTYREKKCLLYGSLAALECSYNNHSIRIRELRPSGRFQGEYIQVQIDQAKQEDLFPQWSPVLMLDGKLFNAEYLPSKAKIRFSPYQGPVARVKLEIPGQFTAARVLLRSDKQTGWITKSDKQDGMIRRGQENSFVPGGYGVVSVVLEKGEKNVSGQSLGLVSKPGVFRKQFTFREGDNSLKVGPPLRMECKIQRDGEMLSVMAVDILGVAGERYLMHLDRKDGDSCSWFVRAAGREQELGKLEFG